MKKITLLFAVSLLLFACNSNDDEITDVNEVIDEVITNENPCTLIGTYIVTSFLMGIPVDFNGDGVYNYDLILESGVCFDTEITFDGTSKVLPPMSEGFTADVNEDINGILTQAISCFGLSSARSRL